MSKTIKYYNFINVIDNHDSRPVMSYIYIIIDKIISFKKLQLCHKHYRHIIIAWKMYNLQVGYDKKNVFHV